jgi:hypothetical protein
MPRKRTPSHASALVCASTHDLLAELRRRSLGCMVVCVRAEEHGDSWHYALKGSHILLGAMSAALSMQTTHRLSATPGIGDGGDAVIAGD